MNRCSVSPIYFPHLPYGFTDLLFSGGDSISFFSELSTRCSSFKEYLIFSNLIYMLTMILRVIRFEFKLVP